MGPNSTPSQTGQTPLVVSLGMVVVDEIRFADGKVLVDVPGGSGSYCGFDLLLFYNKVRYSCIFILTASF